MEANCVTPLALALSPAQFHRKWAVSSLDSGENCALRHVASGVGRRHSHEPFVVADEV